MIKWEDGELVSPAKVNDDGTITPAEYSGNTPLSAHNLNKAQELTDIYKGTGITASTCEGFGKIHKIYGKTEETGEGEKSVDNPYEINCIGTKDINIFQKNSNPSTYGLSSSFLGDGAIRISGTATNANIFLVDILKIYKADIKAGNCTFCFYNKELPNITIRLRKHNGSTKEEIARINLASENISTTINLNEKIDSDTTMILMDIWVANSNGQTVDFTIKPKAQNGDEIENYSDYGEGSIEITSTDGTNTSSKVINCKPLCCLKNSEGNIIAQDYIDFTRQKIIRQCKYINSYNSESINTDYISSTGSLTAGATIVYKLAEAHEEDIDVTNTIVQYVDETIISNSDNAEMEIELTSNKAVSSINESIGILQQKYNDIIKELNK